MHLKHVLWDALLVCISIWQKFLARPRWMRESHLEYIKATGTNGCHVARVVLVWMPITFAMNVLAYGFAIASITWVPVALFGATFVGCIALGTLAIFSIFVGVSALLAHYDEVVDGGIEKIFQATGSAAMKVNSRVNLTGFCSATWQLAVALKQGICPKISPPQEAKES